MVLKTMILAGLLAGCAYCSHGYAHEKHGIAGTSVASLDTTQPEFTGISSAVRKGQQIQIVPSETGRTQQQLSTPRFCAALASVECIGRPDIKVKVHPEPTQWRFQWDSAFPEDGQLLVTFDAAPVFVSEQQRIESAPDGSMFLRASDARTQGEKLRFEPQTYKNTVGFWTNQGDAAAWRCCFREPGWYSVALLQGCGAGQGGSEGRIAFVQDGEECSAITCVVKETGHFQNFRWVHTGYVHLDTAGDYTVTIQPSSIKQKAFGDIRAVSIIQQQKEIAEGNK